MGHLIAKIPVAFAAGLLSVVTPCVLPLVHGYLSAVSAVDPSRFGEPRAARRVVLASLPFILGFTVVFVVLGAAAAAIGGVVNPDRQLEIAGFVLVVLGLAFMGLLPWPERVVAMLEHTGRVRPPGPTGGRPGALFRFRTQALEITDQFAVLRPPGPARMPAA